VSWAKYAPFDLNHFPVAGFGFGEATLELPEKRKQGQVFECRWVFIALDAATSS
jgi:hypothetical protein